MKHSKRSSESWVTFVTRLTALMEQEADRMVREELATIMTIIIRASIDRVPTTLRALIITCSVVGVGVMGPETWATSSMEVEITIIHTITLVGQEASHTTCVETGVVVMTVTATATVALVVQEVAKTAMTCIKTIAKVQVATNL